MILVVVDSARLERAWARAYLLAAIALLAIAGVLLWATDQPWVHGSVALSVVAVVLCGWRAHRLVSRGREAVALAEQTARTSRTMMEHVFQSVLDPIVAIDERGLVLTANPAVEQVFGWRLDEVVGENVSMLMGEPYRAEHDGYMSAYLRTGERKAIGKIRKVLGRRRDGSEFPCELSVSEVWTAEGRRFFGVVRDVSEREGFAMRMAAAERLAAVGELAAGVAHEVNNPVNTIINCAQMIKDGDQAPELCEHIVQEGVRIAGFVRELLDVAADRDDLFHTIDVREPLQRALRLLSVRLRRGGVTVHTDLGADVPRIAAKPRRLQQVFLNLLINANDALCAGSATDKRIDVRVETRTVGQQAFVAVCVRDNGPGVPAYNRERIFQPFFTTKSVGEGTGLGLAVSQGIVRDHSGRIVVESEVGKYAEFVVLLPVAK